MRAPALPHLCRLRQSKLVVLLQVSVLLFVFFTDPLEEVMIFFHSQGGPNLPSLGKAFFHSCGAHFFCSVVLMHYALCTMHLLIFFRSHKQTPRCHFLYRSSLSGSLPCIIINICSHKYQQHQYHLVPARLSLGPPLAGSDGSEPVHHYPRWECGGRLGMTVMAMVVMMVMMTMVEITQ